MFSVELAVDRNATSAERPSDRQFRQLFSRASLQSDLQSAGASACPYPETVARAPVFSLTFPRNHDYCPYRKKLPSRQLTTSQNEHIG